MPPPKKIAEMWKEYARDNPVPKCCEKHLNLARRDFYAGAIALHEYITGTEFTAVDVLEMMLSLEKEIEEFERENTEHALNNMPLGSEKLQ